MAKISEDLYKRIISSIGEDVNREGLLDTPKRASKSFSELTRGYEMSIDEIVGKAIFEAPSNDMVVIQNIEFYSLCEHHLLPFFGVCHVGYIPKDKIIGLSKIPRIVDMFSRRLQVQENLTMEISQAISEATDAIGVGVVIEARHLCMMMRGVSKQNSSMKTSSMQGVFRSSPATRDEFLKLLN